MSKKIKILTTKIGLPKVELKMNLHVFCKKQINLLNVFIIYISKHTSSFILNPSLVLGKFLANEWEIFTWQLVQLLIIYICINIFLKRSTQFGHKEYGKHQQYAWFLEMLKIYFYGPPMPPILEIRYLQGQVYNSV